MSDHVFLHVFTAGGIGGSGMKTVEVEGNLRILNMKYTSELTDPNSALYAEYSNHICDQI